MVGIRLKCNASQSQRLLLLLGWAAAARLQGQKQQGQQARRRPSGGHRLQREPVVAEVRGRRQGERQQGPEAGEMIQSGAAQSSHGQQAGAVDKTSAAASRTTGSNGASVSTSRRFEVHRAILAARCPYFHTLFESGLADAGARELTLCDTDPDALAVLLRFMYGGSTIVESREQVRTCMVLADRLLLPQVVDLLREHLLSTYSAATLVADLPCAAGLWQPPHPGAVGAGEVATGGVRATQLCRSERARG
ncbi:hypothetical protein HYH02_012123 [Chlamydomonas schloesseri]|uniref:BTB domain-containing protein n=1 Tax=Chlamydomonas schloesseri TaxID=2026947 RepID=A0A835T9N4_9CHLO|nr:hypothetical protein HYH02_012123 [Chlamydomonas schloesseri]|eukprot:KAG2434925.1 hypothetical protein HYH02_012123 [Chlamydomonas schloesseri]